MGKLVYTSNVPFDLRAWEGENLVKVVAGMGCVMALTAGGKARQRVTSPSCAIREDYWYDLKDIALSKVVPGAAIGLMNDGTCMISKRAMRKFLEGVPQERQKFDRINNAVRGWKNIRQVACSDAFFALDAAGRVQHVCFAGSDQEYRDVLTWENVVRIVPCSTRNGLFGITAEGKVLCAGSNLTRGPMGDLRSRLAALSGVTDIATSGSEGEQVMYTTADGRIFSLRGGQQEDFFCADTAPVLEGHWLAILNRKADGTVAVDHYNHCPGLEETASWQGVTSMALGDVGYGTTFALGVIE